jgi:hypothetical protein
MDSARWQQVVDLYESARECEPSTRAEFLAESCAGDAELQREVESILEQDVSVPGVLESVAQSARRWMAEPPLPAFIGTYRIRALIGEGGMGAPIIR